MGSFELISAILLILSCIFIVVIVFFQSSDKGGMSGAITGQSSDNYYERNMGRSKEARLKRLTTFAAVLFFSVAIAVSVIAVHFSDDDDVKQTPPADDSFAELTYLASDDSGVPADDTDNGADINADTNDNAGADANTAPVNNDETAA